MAAAICRPASNGTRSVVTGMHHKRRNGQFGKQVHHIDVAVDYEIAYGVCRGGRDALQLVEPVGLLLTCPRNELRGEELAKRWIILPPAHTHKCDHCRVHLLFGFGSYPLIPTNGKA